MKFLGIVLGVLWCTIPAWGQVAPAPGGGGRTTPSPSTPRPPSPAALWNEPLAVPTPQAPWQSPLADLVQRARASLPEARDVVLYVQPRFGTIRILRGNPLAKSIENNPRGVLQWLQRHRVLLGLDAPSAELRLSRRVPPTGQAGVSYYTFQQQHAGLPIVDAELTVRLDAQGWARQITGHFVPSFDLEVGPTLNPARAQHRAARAVGYRGQPRLVEPRQNLVVFISGPSPRLAWEVTLGFHRPGRVPLHAKVYVDAHSGMVLGTRAILRTAGTPVSCNGDDWTGTNRTMSCTEHTNGAVMLTDQTTLTGSELLTADSQFGDVTDAVLIQATNGTTFTHTNGVSAHFSIGVAYDYYKSVHGRPSWNHTGSDTNLGQISLVNYGQDLANAMATVALLENEEVSLSIFGNGDGLNLLETTQCLDVAGHELTHNIDRVSAGFLYQNQPGALDEHFADAFGVAIDKTYEDSDDIMGENCTPEGAGIRSMSDPALHGQPDHMDDFQILPNTEEGDYGGVHINSGIPNRAFYLFYTNASLQSAEKVWYRALTQGGLTAQAQFLDFTNAILTACDDLEASAVCEILGDSLGAVGLFASVGNGQSCPPNSTPAAEACICHAGYRPSTDGTTCEPIAQITCPENSTQHGEYCFCNDGYVHNDTGDACVPEGEGPCPENAHRVGELCYCDEGYYGNPNGPAGACYPEQGDCPDFAHFRDGACHCLDGFEMVSEACMPLEVGCGNETFLGRCVGHKLVYCEIYDAPDEFIVVRDCSQDSLSCGYNTTTELYECIPYVDPCEGVSFAGECLGNTLRFCAGEGDERQVVEYDCTDYDAICQWNAVDSYYGCAPTDCTAGESGNQRCVDTVMQACNGTSWILQIDCADTGLSCLQTNATQAQCALTECSEAATGNQRCVNSVMEACNGTDWILQIDCADSGLRCRQTNATQAQCADDGGRGGGRRRTRDDEGCGCGAKRPVEGLAFLLFALPGWYLRRRRQ